MPLSPTPPNGRFGLVSCTQFRKQSSQPSAIYNMVADSAMHIYIYVDAGVVEHDPSRRDGPLELLLELPVVAEEVSCQRLGHGVDHSEALADLVHLLPTKSADFSWSGAQAQRSQIKRERSFADPTACLFFFSLRFSVP